MKKKISVLIAGLLTAALICGCGGVPFASSSAPAKSSAQTSTPSPAAPSKTKTDNNPSATQSTSAAPAASQAPAAEPAENTGIQTAEAQASSKSESKNSEAVYEITDAAWESGECYEEEYWYDEPFNTEEYDTVNENGFRQVSMTPLSTFAADVDTASYANLRRMIMQGYEIGEIPSGAVRAEEMINYFTYNYNGPEKDEPFGVNAVISDCPWNSDHKLLMLGLQTEKIDFSEAPDTNLVLLIDVSGSMDEPYKLPLLQEAIGMLIDELGEKDRVSIVTYASSNEIVLDSVPGSSKDKIMRAVDGLMAHGSTNGGEGIISAYKLAEKSFIEGGNNRVIIASDGDFNVGITSESDLHDLITAEKEKGIFLSVLGFGYGNYSDSRMETLADDGNGNYSYIDSIKEAKKVLVEELGATLVTVAKDVKLQIEFNPAYVSAYRQIGYENRQMAAEDFSDDTKDGGEVGMGHSVTVLYELVPAGEGEDNGSGLKYQERAANNDKKYSGEWLTLSVRYKEPDGEKSRLVEYPVGEECVTEDPDEDFIFAAAVAEFSMVLGDSEYIEDGSLRHVKRVLDEVTLDDEYKEEFAELVYMLR